MVAILDRLQSRRRQMERRSGMQRAVRFAASARRSHVVVDDGFGHRVSPCGSRAAHASSGLVIRMLMRMNGRDLRSSPSHCSERAGWIWRRPNGNFNSTPNCVSGLGRAGSSRLPIVTADAVAAQALIGQRRAAFGAEAALGDVRAGEGLRSRRASRRSSDIRTPANAMNGPPLAFWHIRQWQMFERRRLGVETVAHGAALATSRQVQPASIAIA